MRADSLGWAPPAWTGYQSSMLDSLSTIDLSEPLAVAEQPWYAPPWMSARRPAGFAAPPPTPHYESLFVEPAALTFPDPAEFRVTTPDGLQAFLVEDALLPLINLTVYIDAPTTHDPAGQEGLSELTAKALRQGGAGPYDAAGLSDALAAVGASLSIDADHNRTRLHLRGPAQRAHALVDLAGYLVTAPRFDAETVASERDRQALQAARAADNAPTALRQRFHRALYGSNHPLGRFSTEASVGSLTADDVKTFHAQWYRPERVTVAISGAIDRARLSGLLAGAFAFATGAPETPAVPEETLPRLAGRQTLGINRDTRQAHAMLGHHGLQGRPENHAAIELMHYILAGGGFVSRMMEELRVQTGITSALYGELEPGRRYTAPYLWRFSGNPETLAEGIDRAIRQIEHMAAEGVTEDEVEAARNGYLAGFIPASYDTPHKTAERLAYHALTGQYAYQARQYMHYYAGDAAQVEALQAVTAADVTAAARELLQPGRLVIAVAGPLDEVRAHADPEHQQWLAPAE